MGPRRLSPARSCKTPRNIFDTPRRSPNDHRHADEPMSCTASSRWAGKSARHQLQVGTHQQVHSGAYPARPAQPCFGTVSVERHLDDWRANYPGHHDQHPLHWAQARAALQRQTHIRAPRMTGFTSPAPSWKQHPCSTSTTSTPPMSSIEECVCLLPADWQQQQPRHQGRPRKNTVTLRLRRHGHGNQEQTPAKSRHTLHRLLTSRVNRAMAHVDPHCRVFKRRRISR